MLSKNLANIVPDYLFLRQILLPVLLKCGGVIVNDVQLYRSIMPQF